MTYRRWCVRRCCVAGSSSGVGLTHVSRREAGQRCTQRTALVPAQERESYARYVASTQLSVHAAWVLTAPGERAAPSPLHRRRDVPKLSLLRV